MDELLATLRLYFFGSKFEPGEHGFNSFWPEYRHQLKSVLEVEEEIARLVKMAGTPPEIEDMADPAIIRQLAEDWWADYRQEVEEGGL